jgi:hypothetical protein
MAVSSLTGALSTVCDFIRGSFYGVSLAVTPQHSSVQREGERSSEVQIGQEESRFGATHVTGTGRSVFQGNFVGLTYSECILNAQIPQQRFEPTLQATSRTRCSSQLRYSFHDDRCTTRYTSSQAQRP